MLRIDLVHGKYGAAKGMQRPQGGRKVLEVQPPKQGEVQAAQVGQARRVKGRLLQNAKSLIGSLQLQLLWMHGSAAKRRVSASGHGRMHGREASQV